MSTKWRKYMKTCKQACSYVFIQENYVKAHVLVYFLHLVLTFIPHYIIMVKGPQHHIKIWVASLDDGASHAKVFTII